MNKTLQEANTLASEVLGMVNDEVKGDVKVVFCTPFPYLQSVKTILGNNNRYRLLHRIAVSMNRGHIQEKHQQVC
jgi:triosephosphate isomerase